MKKFLSIVLSLITLLCVAALCACNVTFKGSPSASPAASDGNAESKSGPDPSSSDVSALMVEIESLQARIDELEADVRYLEKACFPGPDGDVGNGRQGKERVLVFRAGFEIRKSDEMSTLAGEDAALF